MPKRSRARKRSTARRVSHAKVDCNMLLVVDQTPFLKKALSTCKRLRNELNKKQTLLRDFEENDQAAFDQWFNRTFGKRLTQNRELQEALEAKRFILHHISQCASIAFESVPELYDVLMKREKEGTLYSYEPDYIPENLKRNSGSSDWDDDDDVDDPFDEYFEDDEFSEDESGFKEFFDSFFGGGGSTESHSRTNEFGQSSKVEVDIRLKTLYRSLAKRLHPDHSDLEEPIREKRWHEMQKAYQEESMEGLQRIEAICDMDETGLTINLGLARLRDLAAYHKEHLIPLRNALRVAKKDVTFGFAQKGPTAALKKEISYDLRAAMKDLKETIYAFSITAQGVRDEVVEELRESERLAAKAKQRQEQKKAHKAKKRPQKPKTVRKPAKSQKPKPRQPEEEATQKSHEPEDPRQMSFF